MYYSLAAVHRTINCCIIFTELQGWEEKRERERERVRERERGREGGRERKRDREGGGE